MKETDDFIEHLERIDRFYDGEEEGDLPLDELRARGIEIPEDEAALSDEAVHAKLWEVIGGMAEIGMVVECTDHLTNRELYRWLIGDALRQPTVLGGLGAWHLDPLGACSAEDIDTYLRFHADDEWREDWAQRFGDPLPPKEAKRADRDRLLPTSEIVQAMQELRGM